MVKSEMLTVVATVVCLASIACGDSGNRYQTCPSFGWEDDLAKVNDEVTLHPDLVEDTIEAIRRELKDPHTVERLEIEVSGEAIQVTVTDTGTGDRWTGPRYELGDGSELYRNIHLWGSATFEDGSEISFHVWAYPIPSGSECEIQGVALQPSGFVPI